MTKAYLIRKVDTLFLAMVNCTDERDYMYNFGQYNAYLSMLFMEKMISIDEYKMMVSVKKSFYFSITRNEVFFK